jgi:hypothetical protein
LACDDDVRAMQSVEGLDVRIGVSCRDLSGKPSLMKAHTLLP